MLAHACIDSKCMHSIDSTVASSFRDLPTRHDMQRCRACFLWAAHGQHLYITYCFYYIFVKFDSRHLHQKIKQGLTALFYF